MSPNNPDWRGIAYLADGDARQVRAFNVLQSSQLLQLLARWTPILAGTIPIGIAVPGSDLDILCEVDDLEEFQRFLDGQFGAEPGFVSFQCESTDGRAVVCRFRLRDEPIEIFGTGRPVEEQTAFRHMVVEWKLLHLAGSGLASRVRALKRKGIKTEPAFAQCLGIAGDPYRTLLEMSGWDDDRLARWVRTQIASPMEG